MKHPMTPGDGVYMIVRYSRLETFDISGVTFKQYCLDKPGYAQCTTRRRNKVKTLFVPTAKLFGHYQDAMREVKRLSNSSKAGHAAYKAAQRQRIQRFITEDDE